MADMRLSHFLSRLNTSPRQFLLTGALLVFLGPISVSGSIFGVDRVSFTERSDKNGYVVRIHASDHVSAHGLPQFLDDNTFEVTLIRTELSRSSVLDDPAGPVSTYTVDQVGRDILLRFDLKRTDVNVTAYRDHASEDVLISIAYAPDLSSGSADRWTLDTIVIDAGHGGKDSGAIGPGNVREKDVVLSVARKLGSYLENQLGVNVVYTRDTDQFISLQGRGHLANQAEGKLFVSIHANSAGDRRARGTETYFLGMHKSDAAKKVMDRENEVIRFEKDTSEYETISTRLAIMQSLAQSAFMRQSQMLAEMVETQFRDRVGRRSRGVKQAGFYVLYGASMPSILVELGFISNVREAAFMSSEDGQAYLASAIFRAIRDYKAESEKGISSTINGR